MSDLQPIADNAAIARELWAIGTEWTSDIVAHPERYETLAIARCPNGKCFKVLASLVRLGNGDRAIFTPGGRGMSSGKRAALERELAGSARRLAADPTRSIRDAYAREAVDHDKRAERLESEPVTTSQSEPAAYWVEELLSAKQHAGLFQLTLPCNKCHVTRLINLEFGDGRAPRVYCAQS